MLQLLKLRTALRPPADVRAAGPRHISPHSSSPRNTPRMGLSRKDGSSNCSIDALKASRSA
jgi:hypothetical protein